MKSTFSLLAFLGLTLMACSSPETGELVDQQLIYLSSRGSGFDLYLNNQTGTEETQLTYQPGWDWGPRWWAAKGAILHYSQDTSNNFSHQLISMAGKRIEMNFPDLTDFIASPDGQYALFTKKADTLDHVFMYNLASKTTRDITPRAAYHGRPKWSPDSQSIVMISDFNGNQELYLYQLADGSITQLTNGEGRAKYASWSPDGKKIAFTREVLGDQPKDHDIFILSLADKTVEQLTNSPWGEQEISWSPMGDKIAYHGTIDGQDDIYTIEIGSGKITKITQAEGYHGEPEWVPIFRQ